MKQRYAGRIKFMYKLEIIRNGDIIYRFKRKRDLLVWRGQSILAYLLSQGAVGTSTSAWKFVISANEDSPDMGDDSGDPLNNEFNPTLGDPVDVTYEFEPVNPELPRADHLAPRPRCGPQKKGCSPQGGEAEMERTGRWLRATPPAVPGVPPGGPP